MLRALMAVFLAFAITIAGTAKPAYAYSGDSNIVSVSPIEVPVNSDSFIEGIKNGAGVMIGGILVCYSLTLATPIFAPAATLAAFCPSLTTTATVAEGTGVTQIILKGFREVVHAH
ncbi:hypothetical protein [Planktothrix sp. PCC 11201]|uniref:hypothetical protein n=1 Tax=Planktothrix sp. PCC 11201 TaxID=1729650 RepID=UPI0009A70FE2|nr:hypothetical protein [Planktothrix sp. PCC 11201]